VVTVNEYLYSMGYIKCRYDAMFFINTAFNNGGSPSMVMEYF
jgi:hypothetical protein